MTTRERILDEALTLFSESGYGDVYVGDIADAVGIKAPSLYKHFKNKQEIFDALILEMSERYSVGAANLGINGSDTQADASIYENINEDALIEAGKGLFLFFLHDSYQSRFRKMLALEQFRNAELGSVYTKLFYQDPIEYQTGLFELLIKSGKIKNVDPKLLATEFYSTIYTLLTVCDRDPNYEPEAIILLENHIKQFNKNYGKG